MEVYQIVIAIIILIISHFLVAVDFYIRGMARALSDTVKIIEQCEQEFNKENKTND